MTTLDYEMDIHNMDQAILDKLKIDPDEQVYVPILFLYTYTLSLTILCVYDI